MKRNLTTALLLFLAFNTIWFVLHSAHLGWLGLTSDGPQQLSRVFLPGATTANISLALHMLSGAILTIGLPLQALPALRRNWPWLHRRSGYVLSGLAVVTGCAGLLYILLKGTVGGWWMSLWFSIYGGAIIWSAANTFYFATRKDLASHSAWAIRLLVLSVGSWIYRMHYVIWYGLTGGLGSNEALTGAFDRIQVVAFFVPYLLITELFLRRNRMPKHHI